jgi:citrate lyase subunit beta/citryl-CoA lyase
MLRSLIFTPGTATARLPKALESGVDAIILDLEDSVAVQEKDRARSAVIAALGGPIPVPVYVRTNPLPTPFALDDLTGIAATGAVRIMLPKVESASDLHIADWVVGQVERRSGLPEGSTEFLPIIETAKGIAAATAIAAASQRVKRMMFGAVDFALDMNVDLLSELGAISQARFAVALASRVAGLAPPIDTAFLDIGSPERLRASAINARATGFAGKACIHPSQVAVVNEVFSPSPQMLERASRIVSAFEKAEREGRAALMLDGEMIDYPVFEQARRLLAQAPGGTSANAATAAGN